MGGQAFRTPGPDGSPPLAVPRLKPDIYGELKERYLDILTSHFDKLVSPKEAPSKVDHGDIDILVEGPRCSLTEEDFLKQLGAIRCLRSLNSPTSSYAIPLPNREGEYFQLDITICKEGRLEWETFMHSYGDLVQIIAVVHRDAGFTINDRGLHVRIPEIEASNEKASLLFLTGDYNQTLDFFGLDTARYSQGFDDEDQMFRWVTAGHFFTAAFQERRREKANDRQRMAKRPTYRRFIEEWLPAHPEIGLDKQEQTRESILSEAIRHFGAEETYGQMLREHRIKEEESELWSDIAKLLPLEGAKRNLAVRALKRWVSFCDGLPAIQTTPSVDLDSRQLWVSQVPLEHRGKLFDWISINWKEVQTREKERIKSEKHQRDMEREAKSRKLSKDGEQALNDGPDQKQASSTASGTTLQSLDGQEAPKQG